MTLLLVHAEMEFLVAVGGLALAATGWECWRMMRSTRADPTFELLTGLAARLPHAVEPPANGINNGAEGN